MFINMICFAQELEKPKDPIKPKLVTDSTNVKIDSIIGTPVPSKEIDSVALDTLPKKEE